MDTQISQNININNTNKRPQNLEVYNRSRDPRTNIPLSPTGRTPSPAARNGARNPRASPRISPRSPRETDKLIAETEFIKPPMAGTEVDDFDTDNRETVNKPYPGVDDGFFSTEGSNNPDENEDIPTITTRAGDGGNSENPDNDNGDGDGVRPRRPFPAYPNSFVPSEKSPFPRMPDSEFGGINPDLETLPDVNVYQHKKTLAQGMMDLALFSANANQLRYVLESVGHPYYYPGLTMIGISLILQVLVGIGLIWNARYNVKDEREICIANKINNFTVMGIFLITVINVFISAFGTTSIVSTGNVQTPFPISTRGGIIGANSTDPR